MGFLEKLQIARRNPVVVIFLISTSLTLGVLFSIVTWGAPPETFPVYGEKDGVEYHNAINNILAGRGLSLSPSAPYIPDSLRTPGYPYFAAAVYALFGTLYAISIVQAFMVGGISILTYLLARRYFSYTISLTAGMLSALNLSLMTNAAFIGTDILFLFLLLLSLYIASAAIDFRGKRLYYLVLMAGTIFGLAMLVRPIVQYLPIALLLISSLTFLILRTDYTKKIVLAALLFSICSYAVVTPWVLRNGELYGTYALTSNGSIAMLFYNIPLTHADRFGMTREQAREELIPSDYLSVTNRDENYNTYRQLNYKHAYDALIYDYLSNNLVGYTIAHIKRSLQIFSANGFKKYAYIMGMEVMQDDIPSMIIRGQYSIAALTLWNSVRHLDIAALLGIFNIAFWAILLTSLLVGVWINLKQGGRVMFVTFAALLFVAYFTVINGTAQSSRLRFPMEPFMFILIACGFVYIYHRLSLLYQTLITRLFRRS